MLLSQRDILRFEKRGYDKNYFAKYDKRGYVQLKNRKGYCVFYDPTKHRCNVYADRPAGCRVYPVILDEEKGIVLDDICSSRNTITEKEKKVKGKQVIKLLEQIDKEAAKRRS
jgi:Fe-S-cluster containining protein